MLTAWCVLLWDYFDVYTHKAYKHLAIVDRLASLLGEEGLR